MSEFHVRVVKIGAVEKHPNADSLSITLVDGGYPVIFRTGDFEEGQLAVYVPIDSVVPDTEQWSFLKGHRRIKAKRLRGIFSMGMLAKLPDCNCDRSLFGPWISIGDTEETSETHIGKGVDGSPCCPKLLIEGDNIQELMGIVKYEPAMKSMIVNTDNESDPGFFPKYTDIEGMRRYGKVLKDGEEVVLTEKLHGANGRFAFHEGRLWVGSHNCFKKRPGEGDPVDIWWRAAFENGLEEKLSKFPGIAFYGEVYGNVQDLNYGVGTGVAVRFFDAMALTTLRYLDFGPFVSLCMAAGLETVPVMYVGPWSESLRTLSEGPTTLADGGHTREGFVVRPVVERYDTMVGRVILKLVGESYLLRKEA